MVRPPLGKGVNKIFDNPPWFLSLVHAYHSWLLSVSNPQPISGKSRSTTTKPPTYAIPHHLSTNQIQAKSVSPWKHVPTIHSHIIGYCNSHHTVTPKYNQKWQYLFDLTNSFTFFLINIVVTLIVWLNPLMQCTVAHNVHHHALKYEGTLYLRKVFLHQSLYISTLPRWLWLKAT